MPLTDAALLQDLTPTVEALLDQHLGLAKEWFPHLLVPWGQGRDFTPGEPWQAEAAPLPDGVRSALLVNLLTEDNLPYYFHTIDRLFGADGAWGEWSRRWTAEEGRHSIVLRDFLTVTRLVDPVLLERARMQQVSGGVVPEPGTPIDGFVYVALQELATRVAHRNTGKALGDTAGFDVMARVAADENLHYVFYRGLVDAALQIDASLVVCAIERQVRDFEMPGTGITDFTRHARAIAAAGIYDLLIHHDSVLVPTVLRRWKVPELEGLSPDAERARERLLTRMDRIARAGRRMQRRRQEAERSLEPAAV
jgi:acyl-[acyl-carrier-protein] desaturase